MPIFKIDCECRSCSNEQQHLIELSTPIDDVDDLDDEIEKALDEQAHDCDGCGDLDWAPMGSPVLVVD